MNLKELQAMIKEELDSYMNEEEVDVDVDMDAGDVDADGAEEGDSSEDMLMQIYNMLKDKFEGEEDADIEDEEAGEEDAELAEEDSIEEASEEIEEAKDEDLDEGKKDDEDMKEEVSTEATHLQERFKRLANIIK